MIATVTVSVMLAIPAMAQTKSTTKPLLPPQNTNNGNLAPLTEGECTGLGGKNLDVGASQCASMRICRRADQDGVIHSVCITKSAQ